LLGLSLCIRCPFQPNNLLDVVFAVLSLHLGKKLQSTLLVIVCSYLTAQAS
jgi:hypothetical protein